MSDAVIVWFRRDLRLRDNESLDAALRSLRSGEAIVPLYVTGGAAQAPGAASSAWLAASVRALDATLRSRGSRLVITDGPAHEALARASAEVRAERVYCTRHWTPDGLAEETAVRDGLSSAGVGLHVNEGQLVMVPGTVLTREGRPYKVFTPFFREWSRVIADMAASSGGPARQSALPAPARWPDCAPLPPSSGGGIADLWTPGEAGARVRLSTFIADDIDGYARSHDRADLDATSRLSPHLAFGEVSVRNVVSSAMKERGEGASAFVRQIAWRDFAYHVLHAFPGLPDTPLNARFARLPWREDALNADAWMSGLTGFPLVDAGMRELAQMGWMHNRARLLVGSFLSKDLLERWQIGERHFRERLVDADTALNAFNWQWVAGCGADAAPFFRIFNPAVQGAKVDPEGEYVRRWIPELAGLSARWIHRPWDAPAAELIRAGVRPGDTYPYRLVDHAAARGRALSAYRATR